MLMIKEMELLREIGIEVLYLFDKVDEFAIDALREYKGKKITNYEMESSAIAGLATLMGHEAMTVCVVIANRMLKQFSKDYHPAVKKLVELVLERI